MRDRPARLERALAAAGVEHDVKTYPYAGHSFLSVEHYPHGVRTLARLIGMHAGPRHDAADAWQRIGAFFDPQLRDRDDCRRASRIPVAT